jgi:L-methionine (R)-S-oxide reductase
MLVHPASSCGMDVRMAPSKKPKSRRNAAEQEIRPEWPVWYMSDAPLGSAVRYVASLSPLFNWVGIYVLRGNVLEVGPYIGAKTEHTRISVGKGICGTAVAENRDQNIAQVRSHPNYLACSIETQSELVVLIHGKNGKILGQIDIDSHSENAFSPELEEAVRKVAKELGELWPE